MEDYILKVEELNYNYSDGTHALKGINMNIKKRRGYGYIRWKWCWKINFISKL